MHNPNNSWVFNSPPPEQKGLFAPPAGKHRGLALAMACLMAAAHLVSVLASSIDPPGLAAGMAFEPLQLVITAVNLLLTLLVFLKCVLPGWEPHRGTLGWLLGLWALGSLTASIYGSIEGIRIAREAFVGSGFAGGYMGGYFVGGLAGALYGVVISPQGILLFGVLAKKSTEKVAGLVSVVSLAFSLLAIPLLWLAGRFLLSFAASGLLLDLPEALMPGSLLSSGFLLSTTIASFVLTLCWAVFLFTWPVLDRPVLEK